MAQLNFNANEVAPDTGIGDPLPDGWYNVMVDESDIKPTSNNATTGNAFLSVRFNVIDGAHVGRKLFTNFNIKNANPVAQEIAYKQLSALAHAVGVLMVQDSQQLHAIPLKVRVKIRKGSLRDKNNPSEGTYDDSNDITMYKNINEVTPASPSAAPAAGGFAAPAAPGGFAGFAAPAPVAAPAQAAPAGFAPQPWGQPGAAQPAAPAPVAPPAFAPPAFTPPPVAAPAPVAPPAPQTAPPGWSQDATGQWVQAPAAPVAPPAVAAPVAPPAANPAAAQSLTPPWARQG